MREGGARGGRGGPDVLQVAFEAGEQDGVGLVLLGRVGEGREVREGIQDGAPGGVGGVAASRLG